MEVVDRRSRMLYYFAGRTYRPEEVEGCVNLCANEVMDYLGASECQVNVWEDVYMPGKELDKEWDPGAIYVLAFVLSGEGDGGGAGG